LNNLGGEKAGLIKPPPNRETPESIILHSAEFVFRLYYSDNVYLGKTPPQMLSQVMVPTNFSVEKK
jgi:hypothetical protein